MLTVGLDGEDLVGSRLWRCRAGGHRQAAGRLHQRAEHCEGSSPAAVPGCDRPWPGGMLTRASYRRSRSWIGRHCAEHATPSGPLPFAGVVDNAGRHEWSTTRCWWCPRWSGPSRPWLLGSCAAQAAAGCCARSGTPAGAPCGMGTERLTLTPRRSRCADCWASHVLLPTALSVRRADFHRGDRHGAAGPRRRGDGAPAHGDSS